LQDDDGCNICNVVLHFFPDFLLSHGEEYILLLIFQLKKINVAILNGK
jgi:hypothetical protein